MRNITGNLMKGATMDWAPARVRSGACMIGVAVLAAVLAGCDAGGGTTVPVVAEGIRLDQSSVQLDEGATSRLRVLIQENGQTRDMGGSAQVSWLARDPEIAMVKDGLVTGVRAGVTQVTASIAGKQTAHAEVVVLAVPGSVEILSGDRQSGTVGERLATPIRVRVLDRRGAPMSGSRVEFAVLSASGAVSPAVVTPDADGVAEAAWTLGTRAGAQAVDIRIAGRNLLAGAVSATAAPGPVTEIRVTPADALTNPGGRIRYSAEALDQYGNAVPNARLQWQTPDAAVASVGADGMARAVATGEASIEAVYVAPASAGLTSHAPPENRGKGKLRSKHGSGIPQQVVDLRVSAVSTNSVTLSFTEVDDGFGEAADYQIRYASTPIGGGFNSATLVSQGSCSSPVSGGSIDATRTCRVEGLQSGHAYDFQMVAFNGTLDVDAVIGPESNVATATTSADLVPAVLERIGGNSQTGAVGAQLPVPLAVRVKNALGQPMANVAVRWAVTSGGGQVSSTETSTNSLGVAEVYWTLGSLAGVQVVRSSVNSLTSDFTATGQSVAPQVASVVVTPSTANLARGSSLQLSGEARDAQGRAIAGVTLTWLSSDASKATVSSSGQVSGVTAGTATIRAVSGSVEGSAQIVVDDSYAASHWVEILAGNRQTGTVNNKLQSALRVRIHDGYGQAMPSTPVSWTVIKGGGSLSATQTITDAQGITQVDWTLGSVLGMQEVRVASGSAWANFEATAETATSTRPGTVTTLSADSSGADRIWIRFTEVNDGTGSPANYTLRYHVSPIGWNWGSATSATVGTCADLQGSTIGATRGCWVGGLEPGTSYDIQVVAWRTDASGAQVFSESLSNVAARRTLASGSGTISISPRNPTFESLGATQQLSATARDASGAVLSNPGVTWTSSNTSIATIDSNGMLTARGVGTVLITAAAACCVSDQITVTVQQAVASLSVDPTSASLTRGQTMRLNATVRDANGHVINGNQITWQSSNAGVASVSADGTVSGEASGMASITAASSGRTASANVSVQEASAPSGTAWLNEPATSTTAIDESFNALQLSTQPAGSWAYAWNWWSSAMSIVATDGPHTSPNAVRWTWPAGKSGGDSPGRAVNESGTMSFGSYYIGIWVRWSKPWTNHSSGVNKILYWGELSAKKTGQATSQFILNRRGNVVDLILQWAQSYPGQPGGSDSQRVIPNSYVGESRLASTSVDDGRWHLIELRLDASTNGQPNGRVRAWVDGIMQFDVANVRWAPSGDARFYGINLDPVWGGIGGTKPQTEWMEMDHVRTSGR